MLFNTENVYPTHIYMTPPATAAPPLNHQMGGVDHIFIYL